MALKLSPINQILSDLSKGKISYELGRNRMRELLGKDNINWKEVVPLVLSARGAALFHYEDEGIDSHEIEEKDLIDMIIEKIPLIKR